MHFIRPISQPLQGAIDADIADMFHSLPDIPSTLLDLQNAVVKCGLRSSIGSSDATRSIRDKIVRDTREETMAMRKRKKKELRLPKKLTNEHLKATLFGR